MLRDKERRFSKRRAADLDIRFTIAGQSDDRTACIENFSRGGMLLNSDTALQPEDVIHIRSAEGTPTDALLEWGQACAAKVVFCRKRRKRDKICYGIGVRYHSPKDIHDGPHVSGLDSVVPAPIGCVTLDKQGKIMETNLAFAKMIACTRSEIVGQPLARFAAIEDRDNLHLHRRQVMETNVPHSCHLQLQAHDGQIIDVEFVSNVYPIDGIKVIQCCVRDMAKLKRARAEHESSRIQQSKVVDAINRVFREALTCENEKDVADTCLSVAENLTGSKFGLIGEINPEGRFNTISISNPGWDECKMPDSEATRLIQNMEIRGIDRSTIREGKSRIVNDPASHPDRVGTPEGHPPISSFLGVPLKHGGETIGMIGLGNKESGYDLADQKAIEDLSVAFVEALMRKRAEKRLKESEERFRTVADFTYDWEDWIGPDGKYIYVSPSFERITGYSPDELLKNRQFILTFIHPDDQKKVERHLLDHVSTHGEIGLDFRIINRDGKIRWISHLCQAVYDSAGKWLGRRASNRDITEQKKIEEQFRQVQKMESIGRLAGGVAHDYNNALSVIVGFTELVMDQVDPAGPVRANLNEVLKAARRAEHITRQLLTFARKQTIAPKVLDLNEKVEDILKMLRRLIGENIDLAWLPKAGLWPVKMDPSQIDQVLVNLCVNARDAIAGVGKVIIETDTVAFDAAYCTDHPGFVAGEFVMLAASDNGCGMDKEILDNIFEPFFTTKDMDKGTGLGLATVYGIVKQNKGFINVYSEPDKGTTIKIYLPRHADKAVEIQEESAAEIPPVRGETVLVVEDDLSILNLIRQILHGLGYTLLTAGTPAEAIGLAEKHTGEIHLLITDIIMPGMNGRELAERLQSLYPALKRLFMSGYTANVLECHGVLDEVVQFIQKPFSIKDLAKTVRKALND